MMQQSDLTETYQTLKDPGNSYSILFQQSPGWSAVSVQLIMS
jgi:hypothetical protein